MKFYLSPKQQKKKIKDYVKFTLSLHIVLHIVILLLIDKAILFFIVRHERKKRIAKAQKKEVKKSRV